MSQELSALWNYEGNLKAENRSARGKKRLYGREDEIYPPVMSEERIGEVMDTLERALVPRQTETCSRQAMTKS